MYIYIHHKKGTRIFTEALFMRDKTSELPKCPSAAEQRYWSAHITQRSLLSQEKGADLQQYRIS